MRRRALSGGGRSGGVRLVGGADAPVLRALRHGPVGPGKGFDVIAVTLGSLDNPEAIQPTSQVWTKRRIGWVERLSEIEAFDEFPPA